MPTTFIPGDEQQDEKLNPGQQHADRRFSDLAGAEKRGTINMDDFEDSLNNQEADPSSPSTAADYASKREASSAPSAGWANNVSNGFNKSNQNFDVKGLLKKKGPLAGILGLIGIGGFGVSVLFSPAILLVQMKETMMDKFNTQLASMEVRTTRIMQSKFDSTTTGVCGTKISIGCKYSTLSEKQIAKFKAAGIEVNGPKNILGRTKPESFTLKGGEPVSASEFSNKLRSDPKFRSAVRVAYNPRFAGFSDKVWQKVSSKLGISKARALPDGDDAAKEKAIEEETKSGRQATNVIDDGVTCDENKCTNRDGSELTKEEADAIRADRAAASEAAEAAAESTERSAAGTLGSVGLKGIANTVKVTGLVDTACEVYTAVRSLGYAAKTVRAVQLARYAMVFLNTADQIKAGTATSEDVAYLGGILTNVAYDAASGAKRKAAMDSFGMKYAMFGDVGKSDSYVSQFMAGGGLTGDLIALTSFMDNTFEAGNLNPRSTCRTLANGWVQFGSLAGGIALMLIPGVNVAVTAKDVAQGAAQAVISVALLVLPSLLKDIVAGTVTKGIVGEDSGNAIVSGSGTLMGQVAQAGGNAAMSVDDAVAYTQTQNEVIAMYAEEEQATKSPLDPTSKYTFLGSIVNQLTPYVSQFSSVSGSTTALFSMVGSSLTSLIPSSSALTTEQLRAGYTYCEDPDYKDLSIATDPFCNIVYGIPNQYLNKDPVAVAENLALKGQIDGETGEIIGAEFKNIVSTCIDTSVPLGSGGADGLGSIENDKNCKINDTNADYYVYWIDQRIESGLDADFDGTENIETTQISSLPTGSEAELAQMILSSGNVTDRTGQLQQIINGTRTDVSSDILQIIAGLSSGNTFTISSMKRDQALNTGAGNASLHLLGKAVDLSGSSGINGVSFGYNGHDDTIQAFLDSVAAIMPENCDIGVPNQAYVNATKPKVKSGCTVFVDIGTAPHIHLDVKAAN